MTRGDLSRARRPRDDSQLAPGPALDRPLRMARLVVVAIILVSWCAGVRQAAAQAAPAAPEVRKASHAELPDDDEPQFRCKHVTGDVLVTFKADTEVKDLVAWAMGFTCKTFLVDPRVVSTGRKVSIIVPSKLSAAQAYRLFLAALSTIGLTVVTRGDVVRVIEAQAAKREPLGLVKTGTPDDVERVVRYVYQPSYVAIEALVPACTAMKSDAGDVLAAGRLLLLTDYASNVRDMLAFAKLVDVPAGSDAIYTLPVVHADAGKLMEKVNSILGLQAAPAASARPGAPEAKPDGAAVPSKIVVDERTNTLIIAAREPGYQRVKALVERLDVALEIEGGSSIHVYPLGSAIAEELAKTLTAAIGDGRAAKPTGAPGPTAPAAASPAPPSALDSLGTAIEGQVRVIADPPTNALIVMSSGRDFFAIKDVIRQLDLPRRQVYIEAMILEVATSNNLDVGTSAHAGSEQSGALLLGGVETSDVNSIAIANSLGGATGLLGGLIGQALDHSQSLLGKSIPSFAVLFHAIADQSTTNIVSSPSIIAIDNVEAKYKVGTTIPVSNGTSFAGSAGGALPPGAQTTSIDHRELPLILNIKPHISTDDSVLLEVKHESLDQTADGPLGPSWSTRSFETRVVVHDQQTVVLGGLTQDKEVERITKVPVLGDLPLLGYLFKTTVKTRSRTNLLVMLTPYIIKDQRDLQTIQRRKLHEHDEFARSSSALDRMKFEPAIDYGKKRGLLEDINRAVADAERDAAARAELPHARGVAAGSVEVAPSEPASEPATEASGKP
jgi:general secretion pathway protein D